MKKLLRGFSSLLMAGLLGATASLTLVRNIHFILPSSSPFHPWIGERMAETFWFYIYLIYDSILFPRWIEWGIFFLFSVILGVLWVLPLFGRDPSPFYHPSSFRRILLNLYLAFGVLLGNILLDSHPALTLSAIVTFLLVLGIFFPFPFWIKVLFGAVGIFFMLSLIETGREWIALGVGTLPFLLLRFLFPQGWRGMTAGEKVLSLYLVLFIVNLLQLLPFLPTVDFRAQYLGPEEIYPFCQVPEEEIVFAGAPLCGGDHPERCERGKIIEYQRRNGRWERIAEHPVIHPSFYGRIVHLLCLRDPPYLLISLCNSPDRHETLGVYDWREKRMVTPRLVPFGGGRVIYIPQQRVIYTGSELFPFSYEIPLSSIENPPPEVNERWRIAELSLAPPHRTPPPSFLPRRDLYSFLQHSYLTEADAYSLERNSIFFGPYIGGQGVLEVDRETLRVKGVSRTDGGAVHSLLVDEEYDRVIVSGIWGVEVLSLKTGKIIRRIRTELAPRYPILDRRRNLIMIPCTYGAQIWVLDRPTLRVLGRIPVGTEARYLLLTRDGETLFFSNGSGHFAISMDALGLKGISKR
jgi:hypothetical protein